MATAPPESENRKAWFSPTFEDKLHELPESVELAVAFAMLQPGRPVSLRSVDAPHA